MVDKLVTYDVQKVLENGKAILRDIGQLPEDCPSPTCLRLQNIRLNGSVDKIVFSSNPPKLPTTRKDYLFDLNPICEKTCGIYGNSNRCFVISQDATSGKILVARGEWDS